MSLYRRKEYFDFSLRLLLRSSLFHFQSLRYVNFYNRSPGPLRQLTSWQDSVGHHGHQCGRCSGVPWEGICPISGSRSSINHNFTQRPVLSIPFPTLREGSLKCKFISMDRRNMSRSRFVYRRFLYFYLYSFMFFSQYVRGDNGERYEWGLKWERIGILE